VAKQFQHADKEHSFCSNIGEQEMLQILFLKELVGEQLSLDFEGLKNSFVI
jgi:hypothetical protein